MSYLEIYSHTPCKLTLYDKRDIAKYIIPFVDKYTNEKVNGMLNKIKYLYTNETFLNSLDFFSKFIKELTFTAHSDKINTNEESIIFEAYGSNNILITCGINNFPQNNIYGSKFVNINRDLVIKIHNRISKSITYTKDTVDWYLNPMDKKWNNTLYVTDNIILSISDDYKYTNREIKDKLKNYSDIDNNEIFYNCWYDAVIKFENYNDLLLIYNRNNSLKYDEIADNTIQISLQKMYFY